MRHRSHVVGLCVLSLLSACAGLDGAETGLQEDAGARLPGADAPAAPAADLQRPAPALAPSGPPTPDESARDAEVAEPPSDAAGERDEGLPCEVAELLETHCFRCHDGTGLKAPMALRERSALLAPLARDPQRTMADEALLRMRSTHAPMPPDSALSRAQIDRFADWLLEGAPAATCDEPAQPPAPPFEAASLPSALAKVKLLLTGEAVTNAELEAARGTSGLRDLVDGWLRTPAGEQKLLGFFEVAFQQSELSPTLLFEQLGQTVQGDALLLARLVENLEQSFARTALRIVKSGRPFTDTLTTTNFELTPALMSYLLLLDDQPIDDAGRRRRTAVPFSVRTEGPPIAYRDSIDPSSASYLQFSAIGATNGCATTTRSSRSGVELFSLLLGRTPRAPSCNPSRSTPVFTDEDFTAFRTVRIDATTLTQPRLGFFDLPALRGANSLSLLIPRLGFFTTPAFFANYPTNDSNTMRVTANQTLIVALSRSFDGSDSTLPLSADGLNADHAGPGSACYACHKTLDPMRMFFRQAFTLGYSDQRDASLVRQRASFVLDGTGVQGVGLSVLARGLAEHPRFAQAWLQKLCFYANAQACSEVDPEFTRVAAAFADSGHDFRVLLRELFSSPLVTGLSPTLTARTLGTHVGIARRNHFCHALSTRLGLPDLCGQAAVLGRLAALATPVAEIIPEDSYSRGIEAPVTPSQVNLFTRSAYESLCVMIAPQVLFAGATSPLSISDVAGTLQRLRSTVMGLPDADPRAQPAQAILSEHFTTARARGLELDALRSTFVLACTSPSSVSIGL